MLLPGFALQNTLNLDPYGFYVDPSGTTVYIADNRQTSTLNVAVYSWSTLYSDWRQVDQIQFTTEAVYSLIGRVEGGDTVLYAVDPPACHGKQPVASTRPF